MTALTRERWPAWRIIEYSSQHRLYITAPGWFACLSFCLSMQCAILQSLCGKLSIWINLGYFDIFVKELFRLKVGRNKMWPNGEKKIIEHNLMYICSLCRLNHTMQMVLVDPCDSCLPTFPAVTHLLVEHHPAIHNLLLCLSEVQIFALEGFLFCRHFDFGYFFEIQHKQT